MKVIDLLNKIANGEELPKVIKYENRILYLEDEADEYPPTFNYYDKDGNNALFEGWIGQYLNDEVEIIEENKEIEKITNIGRFTRNQKKLAHKINELIDKVNELDKR